MQRLTTFSLPENLVYDYAAWWTNIVNNYPTGSWYNPQVPISDPINNRVHLTYPYLLDVYAPAKIWSVDATTGAPDTAYMANLSASLVTLGADPLFCCIVGVDNNGKAMLTWADPSGATSNLSRLNSDGTLDGTFTTYSINNDVAAQGTYNANATINGVAWLPTNSTFVAIGNGGTQSNWYSSDGGQSWTNGTTPSFNGRGICEGNGLLVAVGSTGIITSTNGTSWTSRTAAAANDWEAVAYGNSRYVAVATFGANRAMYSLNGTTGWTLGTGAVIDANSWQSIAFGNGIFVAVAGSGTNRVAWSTDGDTWNMVNIGAFTLTSIAFGNGIFMAADTSGGIYTSPDGITWTTKTSAAWGVAAIGFGSGQFWVAAVTATNGQQYTTDDGTTWKNPDYSATPSGRNWTGIAHNGSVFVGCASSFSGTNQQFFYTIPQSVQNQGFRVQIDSNDDIILIGDTLQKLDSTGAINTTFATNIGTGLDVSNSYATKLLLDSSDNIYLAGTHVINGNSADIGSKLSPSGVVDTTYISNINATMGTWFAGDFYGATMQSDKLVAFGPDPAFSVVGLWRFNSDGTQDSTWNSNFQSFAASFTGQQGAFTRPDGKIFTVGSSGKYMRVINTDGTQDSTYYNDMGSGLGSNAPFLGVGLADNSVVIGGYWNNFSGQTRFSLAKLPAVAGATTPSFAIPAGVTEITVQPVNSSGVPTQASSTITVVPNTSYVITINSSSYSFNNPNTLGSLFTWSASSNLLITWTE